MLLDQWCLWCAEVGQAALIVLDEAVEVLSVRGFNLRLLCQRAACGFVEPGHVGI